LRKVADPARRDGEKKFAGLSKRRAADRRGRRTTGSPTNPAQELEEAKMAYKFGTFVWFECITDDVEASKAFYTETLGWKSKELDMGGFKYTMLSKGEATQCGVVEPQMEGVPNQWTSYVSVEDVDAAAKRVTQHGGKVLVPATDIPTVGRFALVSDPEGATFNLFKGEQSDDTSSTEFHWNELYADNIDKLAPFYEKVLGYTTEKMDMGGGGPYTVFKKGDQSVGGGMNKPEKIPSMWLPYVAVENVDKTLARAKAHKATVKMGPQDVPTVGRFAVCIDSQGAAFGVIAPEKR
jgi:predicted enzyme related to lactoylglutathione lyase